MKNLAHKSSRFVKKIAPFPDNLAVNGGHAVRLTPFAPWPHFDTDEISVVTSILTSGKVNYWTGDQGKLFEQEFASFIDCKHAIAIANGTVALELALRALGIGPGDEVIVPCRTYIASASCAVLTSVVCGVEIIRPPLPAPPSRALHRRRRTLAGLH